MEHSFGIGQFKKLFETNIVLTMKNIPIAISTCPNDTFIFAALVNGWIDTPGYQFRPVFADIDRLNQWMDQEKYPVIKVSYHAWAYCRDKYHLLQSGGALGHGCGPLLISVEKFNMQDINPEQTVAIPGYKTTANFLLSVFFPKLTRKKSMIFSDIEDAVIHHQFDLGLIIHENRFTYAQKGLHKVADLGEMWENLTQSPIPLGAIVAHKDFTADERKKIDHWIKSSLEFAYQHTDKVMEFVKKYAQNMDPQVMKNHIDLYVNQYSFELGKSGNKAVECLLDFGKKNHLW